MTMMMADLYAAGNNLLLTG